VEPLLLPKGSWSSNKNEAPVWRLGGSEFTLANEQVFDPGNRRPKESIVNRVCNPGDCLKYDGSFNCFSGSSPNASWMYVGSGHKGLKLSLEFPDSPEFPPCSLPLHKG